MEQSSNNIQQHISRATIGLNMDNVVSQLPSGTITYSLNAAMENYDANSFSYQNEEGNELCLTFPNGLVLIGTQFISEKNKHVFFLTNPDTGESEIGFMDNNDCNYHTLINAPCLNFDINHPILKVAHKITTCSTEIYWTDGINSRRYLNIDDIPNMLKPGSTLCDPTFTDQLDCNQLKVQPNFNIPLLTIIDIVSGGDLISGTYQFAIQYSDALGNPYNSYQSITNPTSIADPLITTINFNYPVDKAIVVQVSDLDITGQFQYFNLAVIKTINSISTVELVGTFYIDNSTIQITYTGQNVASIPLSIQDIFEKFPFYDIAQDVTATQEILLFSNLSTIDRINYQNIASQIHLQWETWRIPTTENYANELNTVNLRSQLRDEIYPYEIAFILSNGKQTDSFHIPGRLMNNNDAGPDIPNTNPDFIGNPDYISGGVGYSPYWKIYNTASVIGNSPDYLATIDYKGPYQIGEMAYWESIEEYPCNDNVWGNLAGQKIRHHKFPDVLVSPIFESKIFIDAASLAMGNDAVFPIGVHVDTEQILGLIASSNLTHEQKVEIEGYKILRGNRGTNKSIVAKGILRNVGEYTRDNQKYYYPNYPYNDLGVDPFLDITNNAFIDLCTSFDIEITALGSDGFSQLNYTDCITGKIVPSEKYSIGVQLPICSLTKPVSNIGQAKVSYSNYDVWRVASFGGLCHGWRVQWLDRTEGLKSDFILGGPDNGSMNVKVIPGTKPGCIGGCDHCGIEISFIESVITNPNCITNDTTNSLTPNFDNGRLVFNSPETSFGQPFLGSILKLESVIYGKGLAHFIQVKNNAKYKLLTEDAQRQALIASEKVAGTDTSLLISAYQAYLQIYINGMTSQNYAYSFNSIANYNYSDNVPNNSGVKQRNLDIARYLIPIVESVGDDKSVNNYQRESSVFLKTNGTNLPFPNDQISINNKIADHSRFTISEKGNCSNPSNIEDITVISYYASLKKNIVNQWGQIYSYETIDTGFERVFKVSSNINTAFGGDTFISRFGFKTKLPFFLDNRVNAPDSSDIFYDQIGNVAYPKYWHSARSVNKDYMSTSAGILPGIISYKAHKFDCPTGGSTTSINNSTSTSTTTFAPGSTVVSNSTLFYDGYFYLFAYGIPYFYCESSYNTDLRQAFNTREGDFYPHVTTSIPDDWVQESWVPIAQDNTYYYNTTYSKQNTENTFTHLPIDWDRPCLTFFPFRVIYSDVQTSAADNRVNAWLTFRALSYFDFPQNYGPLVSLDGIQNRVILARFEDKSLLYNNLITINTSNPQAAYVGNADLFKGPPPIDFAETDLGYMGTQNKFLLKIPQGQITVDAKRGQIFLISDTQAIDLSAFGSGMNRFFTDHLAFEILRYFPDVNTDNHFAGIGLHGVYDSKYDRVIITKLDYIPTPEFADIMKFDSVTNQFYIEEELNTDATTSTSTTSTSTTSTSTTSSSTSSTSSTTSTSTTIFITGICNYIQSVSTGTVHSPGIDTGIIGDDEYGEVFIPFTFRFYNTDYNSVFATTDGYLSFFDPSSADYNNVVLPYDNGFGILSMILPLWTDLSVEPAIGHVISTITEGVAPNRVFIINYVCSTFRDRTDPTKIIHFEIRMYETSNNLEIVYGTGTEFSTPYTIGIQENDGTFFTQFSYGTDSVTEGDLIRYIFDDCNNTTTTTTTAIPSLSLRLLWDNIANVPIADASSISDWNTFFDLPTNGNPFTSVVIIGNEVNLIGGSGIKLKDYLFADNINIIEVNDITLCVISIGDKVFASSDGDEMPGCTNLITVNVPACLELGFGCFVMASALRNTDFSSVVYIKSSCFSMCQGVENLNFPSVTIIENYCFQNTNSLTFLSIPICTSLGSTLGDTGVFDGYSRVITLTIPAVLMTCNDGQPDGDIQYLQANNTVTIITV